MVPAVVILTLLLANAIILLYIRRRRNRYSFGTTNFFFCNITLQSARCSSGLNCAVFKDGREKLLRMLNDRSPGRELVLNELDFFRQEEIENEENQEMEAIQAGETPEDSTFTLSSSDGMSTTPWERPVMRFADIDTTRLTLKEKFLLESRSDENLFVGEISPTYTNGNVFFHVLPRSTPV